MLVFTCKYAKMIDPYKFLDAFVYAVRLNKLAQSVYTVYIRVMYNFFYMHAVCYAAS